MSNPDYWSRPIQSDRNRQSYGHTRITPSEPQQAGCLTALVCLAIVIGASSALVWLLVTH